MSAHPELEIDIEKIINSRSKKKMPKFLINFFKKFIHQDLINEFLVKGYEGTEFCSRAIEHLGVKLDVRGMEKLTLPEGSRYCFVSNHPLGGIDGLALGAIIGEKFDGKIAFLANDFLMNIKGIAKLCVPVNKIGAQSRELSSRMDEVFESDRQLIIFPAGLCSRKIGGIIQDIRWGKMFVKKSVQYGRYVMPIRFEAENSKRFYFIANLCKWLKLRFNFAMLFLPDEMYRSRGKTFRVVIGKPIAPESFKNTKTPLEWAQIVRKTVYEQ